MPTAAEIMTPNAIAIRGAETVARAVELMKEHMVSSLLVERRHPQDAYGIVTVTDVICKVVAYGKDPKQVKVYEIMSKPCIVVNPDLAVEYVARLFAEVGIRSAPVIQGDSVGIVSVTDILLKTDVVNRPPAADLEEQLQASVNRAGMVGSEKGLLAPESKQAWRAVADIQAELAHQRAETPEQSAFEEYLAAHPEMADTDDYEMLLEGYMGF
ncbi:CBS domain-containing protein [Synechococcus sp. PCC 7336]|uniref:CBS domain-containing protein n=1 Tax=Synechococcus sp. PCC 7336 TaxID=195250 RepID=UPI00034C9093|nr:CBS domain-containing protein [Synechococcus sp. PCC 7336]